MIVVSDSSPIIYLSIIDQLITNAGFRVSSELYRTFLISLNEKPSE